MPGRQLGCRACKEGAWMSSTADGHTTVLSTADTLSGHHQQYVTSVLLLCVDSLTSCTAHVNQASLLEVCLKECLSACQCPDFSL